MTTDKPVIFVSYSHEDHSLLNVLLKHLRVESQKRDRPERFELFIDQRSINAGDDWGEKIASALERSIVAVLVLSTDFLLSDFVRERELPILSRRHLEGSCKLLPLHLRAVNLEYQLFQTTLSNGQPAELCLADVQGLNDPDRPCDAQSQADLEAQCRDVAHLIFRAAEGKSTVPPSLSSSQEAPGESASSNRRLILITLLASALVGLPLWFFFSPDRRNDGQTSSTHQEPPPVTIVSAEAHENENGTLRIAVEYRPPAIEPENQQLRLIITSADSDAPVLDHPVESLTAGRVERQIANPEIDQPLSASLIWRDTTGRESPASSPIPLSIIPGLREPEPQKVLSSPASRPPLLKLVRIPSGDLTRGSSASSRSPVKVAAFQMSETEVTRKQWREAFREKTPPEPWPESWSSDETDGSLPATDVSWFEALELCNALSRREGLESSYDIERDEKGTPTRITWIRAANGYRLPTEAEWVYACRAGTTTQPYPDPDLKSHGSPLNMFYRRLYSPVRGVASKQDPNAYELQDMIGNALEWCWDAHSDHLDPRGRDGSPEAHRVILNGIRSNREGASFRDASRFPAPPTIHNELIGFRCVRNVR